MENWFAAKKKTAFEYKFMAWLVGIQSMNALFL